MVVKRNADLKRSLPETKLATTVVVLGAKVVEGDLATVGMEEEAKKLVKLGE
ncbi:hypothetical protein SESBI_36971 [Sesbania bispinosa]|nr:hypothetical protein SESBI_36971 [Sesbania bispinosa]